MLTEGIKRFPRLSPLVLATIRLDLRIGERAHAAGLARLGAFYAPDAASKAEFEALAAGLPLPETPSPAAPR